MSSTPRSETSLAKSIDRAAYWIHNDLPLNATLAVLFSVLATAAAASTGKVGWLLALACYCTYRAAASLRSELRNGRRTP
jgi:hypothetical protein